MNRDFFTLYLCDVASTPDTWPAYELTTFREPVSDVTYCQCPENQLITWAILVGILTERQSIHPYNIQRAMTAEALGAATALHVVECFSSLVRNFPSPVVMISECVGLQVSHVCPYPFLSTPVTV